MDPLSLTASILTILGAGQTIAKGLDRMRKLNHAPDVLLHLSNEITDMYLLNGSVDELARWWTQHASTSERQ